MRLNKFIAILPLLLLVGCASSGLSVMEQVDEYQAQIDDMCNRIDAIQVLVDMLEMEVVTPETQAQIDLYQWQISEISKQIEIIQQIIEILETE